jgi:ferredoxin-like protein FixX
MNVEEKLFQNRYKVDHGRPHIRIKDAAVCANDCKPGLHLRLPGRPATRPRATAASR